MSARVLDAQGRWRNVTVAFRVSPEEDATIERLVKLSGLTKQDYVIKRLQDDEVIVQGNPKVYKALRDELAMVLDELKRINAGESVDAELLRVIRQIATIMDGMRKEQNYRYGECESK